MPEFSTITQEESAPRAKVMRWITQAIDDGQLGEGIPVPSERRLSEMLQVSRPTVKAALDDLTSRGLLHRPQGSRLRRVSTEKSSSASSSGLMSQTIAVLTRQNLTDYGDTRNITTHTQTKVMQAITQAGLNGLAVHPNSLAGSGLQALLDSRPRGIIAFNTTAEGQVESEAVETIRASGVPLVVSSEHCESAIADSVGSDHEFGAQELVRLLAGRGRKRILRFWALAANVNFRGVWLSSRDRGYDKAIRDTGLDLLPAIEYHHRLPGPLSGREYFDALVREAAGYLIEPLTGSEPVDAIMAVSDLPALVAANAARLLGRKPGVDLDIVGYDHAWQDVPALTWSTPPLATVRKDHERIASGLLQLLADRADGKLSDSVVRRTVRPVMVELGGSDSVH